MTPETMVHDSQGNRETGVDQGRNRIVHEPICSRDPQPQKSVFTGTRSLAQILFQIQGPMTEMFC